jgi:glycosyltransferase involved in cell wall biosynthesis
VPPELPSFDLVVATVGRVDELSRFLDSLDAQAFGEFRTIVVDQNGDDRLGPVLRRPGREVLRIRAERGLSRARNAALRQVTADIVAFPDDDCVYPPDVLERVAERFGKDRTLDALAGRSADAAGRSSPSWKTDPAVLDRANVWNRANSATLFLRRGLVERVGDFDEELGLGSGTPWHAGEEIDYLLRALGLGARIEYDPSLVIEHPVVPDEPATGRRDGATVGYLLRKHGFPLRTRARMLVRPVGGALVSLARGDLGRARYHAATFRGRLLGLRASFDADRAATTPRVR